MEWFFFFIMNLNRQMFVLKSAMNIYALDMADMIIICLPSRYVK